MENEFDRDYAGEIALECDKLDRTLFVAMEHYDTTAVQLGKNWYSIGLENNDHDKERDNKDKRNILLRVIDKVVEFIKMIGKKIVEWFMACKKAIVKFFARDEINPAEVAVRFSVLIAGLSQDDATKLISKLSIENKGYLAEIMDSGYNKAFGEMYSIFTHLGEKCENVGKLTPNTTAFFSEFKAKSGELKTIAHSNRIYENVDDELRKLLTGSGSSDAIKNVTTAFVRVEAIHKGNTGKLEQLLKKIPDDDLIQLDGDNVNAKRQEMVKLISDVIKVNSEIVLKVNNHMQAVAMLMTYIVKYRSRKVVYIPV